METALTSTKTRESGPSLSAERNLLEEKYSRYFEERLHFRQFVTYVPNKKLPVYNWFKYKEGFSRQLVHSILTEWKIGKTDVIFDPFAGCGTTLLACKEVGYKAVGLDILPIATFVARTKLREWQNLDQLKKAVDSLMREKHKKPSLSFPRVPIIPKAYPERTQEEIMFYKECILGFEKPVQDFLMLGLMSILEEVSYTSKDGQFLRIVERDIPSVKATLRKQFMSMINDLSCYQRSLFQGNGKAEVEILEGDARELSLPKKYWGKIGAVITSPPYLNRYDYSRTYALELCTLFVEDFEGLRDIRHSLLRSHIESKTHQGKELNLPVLDEIIQGLKGKKLNNDRIPIMVKGYFEDMNLVINRLATYLKHGGMVALVVANARFEAEMVPTDLILSELAELNGLHTEKIWVTRYKGNSSQQMARYGKIPVRESIVFWRKNR